MAARVGVLILIGPAVLHSPLAPNDARFGTVVIKPPRSAIKTAPA